jgi:hypothetical protein
MGFEDFIVFGYVMIIILAALGIWFFFKYAFKGELKKNLFRIFDSIGKYLSEKIRRFVEKYSRRGDYEDEHESLFGSLRLFNMFRRKKGEEERNRYGSEIPWSRLKTNRDRIRYIYRHFVIFCIGSGFRFNNKRTPNQVSEEILAWNAETGRLSPYLTELYNEARYGPDDRDIADETVEGALEKTEWIKEND